MSDPDPRPKVEETHIRGTNWTRRKRGRIGTDVNAKQTSLQNLNGKAIIEMHQRAKAEGVGPVVVLICDLTDENGRIALRCHQLPEM